ncbi:hypothetical protein, conserved [Plasmodium gonderi]|uniref:Uncharacterized protein n=1 Tax=Plasmodium gonderi TaxID=77519 RepID=A0A1Y1JTD0_PLAGO|nr:hypothetical protein, conserved [Plasmodium gonderi]GAW83184.1 hypothetical protein, conserved [Plasmodium gonderi]
MRKDDINLKVESVGVKSKKQPVYISDNNANPKRLLKITDKFCGKKGKEYPSTSEHSLPKIAIKSDKSKPKHADNLAEKSETKKNNPKEKTENFKKTLNKTKGYNTNSTFYSKSVNEKNVTVNSKNEHSSNSKDKTQNRKCEPQFIKIKSHDNYLNDLLKKQNIHIQAEEYQNDIIVKKNIASSSSSQSVHDSSSDEFHTSDIIEQFKKKKKRELEAEKKKLITSKKNKLIKKLTYKDVGTQVILDDFTKYYERVKPKIEQLVEDVLNQALKKVYEDQELRKMQNKINHYEQIRQKKYQSLKDFEHNSETFYEETRQKIKDRIVLKNKVEIIMKKKIAHTRAQKNMHHIIQKNLNFYSLIDYFPNDIEKMVNLIVLPWLADLILYLIKVKREIVHYVITDMIEQNFTSRSENFERYKRL